MWVWLVMALAMAGEAELTVTLKGVDASRSGALRCALFTTSKGFPMSASEATAVRVAPVAEAATCRFEGLSAGTYAVAVAHDEDGNAKVNTNLFGIPTEGWGSSNDVVPTLRAPTFKESAVTVDGPTSLAITLHY